MTTIYFVRHAESDLSIYDDLTHPLTEAGLQAIKSVTKFLLEQEIDHVFSSPFKWAIDTVKDFADQGWHYQHTKWITTLKNTKIFQSMSRKATCADNAVMESFFGILKQEIYYGEELLSYHELKQKIEQYIDYYNNDRIKVKLAGLSPVQYRTQTSQTVAL